MAYTQTTSTSWFSRLGSSFRGIGLGIALIIIGTIMLWWNEGNFVTTGDALDEARSVTQELGDISRLDNSKNGKLVHATGPVETKDMLNDPVFGFSINAIRLERTVEFFQWVENSKTETRQKLGGGEERVTTYTYSKQWVKRPVDSSQFRDPNAPRLNRNFVIANVENYKAQAANVTFGAYRLPGFLINSISGAVPLSVIMPEEAKNALNEQLIRASEQARPRSMESFSEAARSSAVEGITQAAREAAGLPQGQAYGDVLAQERSQEAMRRKPGEDSEMVHFSGNTVVLSVAPAVPQIGDVRVTFMETKPGTVSIIAKLTGDTFETYRASNGTTFSKLVMGTHSLDNMYGDAHSSNVAMTWALRFVGAILVMFGLKMILAPLVVAAQVIPLFGSIVGAGTGLVSTLLGLAWSLLIISIAWLRFRPVIGLAMIAVAGALVALLYVKGRASKAVNAQAPAPETVNKV